MTYLYLKPFEIHQIRQTITTYTNNQKGDTPGIRNGALFLHKDLSTSNEDKVYIAKLISRCRTRQLYSGVTKSNHFISMSQNTSEMGHFIHELDKPVWCRQFSANTHLPHSGSSPCLLQDMAYPHLKPVEICWMWPHSMSPAQGTRNGPPPIS